MTVSAPKDANFDVRLPQTPEQVDDPKAFKEFMVVYAAIRSLQASVAQSIVSLQSNASIFESAEQAITVNTAYSVAHGLGATPKFVDVFIRCKTAELGYSVGAEVRWVTSNASSGSTYNISPSLYATGTTVGCTINQGIGIINLTTFTLVAITAANWKLVFRARLA